MTGACSAQPSRGATRAHFPKGTTRATAGSTHDPNAHTRRGFTPDTFPRPRACAIGGSLTHDGDALIFTP